MFPTKKSEIVEKFTNFSEKELSSYSKKRNFDYGPPHKNVSKLSPYLRTRFISEEEVLKIALSKNNIKNSLLIHLFYIKIILLYNIIFYL